MKNFRHGDVGLIFPGWSGRRGIAAGWIKWNGFHHHPRLKFLQAFDDDAFPGLQPVCDNPFVPNGLADFNFSGLHIICRAHHHDARDAVRANADAALENGDRLGINRLFQHAAREHPRQQQMVGIGKLGPQRDHAIDAGHQ